MKRLIVCALAIFGWAGICIAEEQAPAHLFDDLNGNGISDKDEAPEPQGTETGGGTITDPGEGDGYIENPS